MLHDDVLLYIMRIIGDYYELEKLKLISKRLNKLIKLEHVSKMKITEENKYLLNDNFSTKFKNLKILDCSDNHFTSLPTLPTSLTKLNCSFNILTSLPTLPPSLTKLWCFGNQLTSLPTLPTSLTELRCHIQFTSLPTLPPSLIKLDCNGY